THGVDVRVPRIFNTFGPAMRLPDGRAVPTFVGQALRGEPLTVFGDGLQTRSLCYVHDPGEGLVRLLARSHAWPANLGAPQEGTMIELPETSQKVVGSTPGVVHQPAPVDDPKVRRPDTTVARRELGWEAEIPLEEGLRRT